LQDTYLFRGLVSDVLLLRIETREILRDDQGFVLFLVSLLGGALAVEGGLRLLRLVGDYWHVRFLLEGSHVLLVEGLLVHFWRRVLLSKNFRRFEHFVLLLLGCGCWLGLLLLWLGAGLGSICLGLLGL
jgi:hypothetical protein